MTWKHLSKGPSRSCCCCWKASPPNKAISQSPSHPAPPLPASLFPPFQTSDHSSLCLTSPDCCRPDPASRNAPAGAQPATAVSQTSSAQGRRGRRGGRACEGPCCLCSLDMSFSWKSYLCVYIVQHMALAFSHLAKKRSTGLGSHDGKWKIILSLGTSLPKRKEHEAGSGGFLSSRSCF